MNAFQLVTNLVTAAFIVLSILLLKPMVALAMIGGLAGGYALIYIVLLRGCCESQAQSLFAIEQAQICMRAWVPSEEITVMQVQNFRGDLSTPASPFRLKRPQPDRRAKSPAPHGMRGGGGLVGLALVLAAARAVSDRC